MEQIIIRKLINNITPLYNSYKKNNKEINGTDALIIMWDIGDLLNKAMVELTMKPHVLYRNVYGKSENKENIVQKSYITREFLGRAYRIRRIFKNKEDVKKILPTLKRFISFRESMPFFDNKKYILAGKEKSDLLLILNSNNSQAFIMKTIKELQSKKIGVKNTRLQRLGDLEEEKKCFIDFYNYIFDINNQNNNIKIKIDKNTLSRISLNTGALVQEGLFFVDIPEENFDDKWLPYVNLLKRFCIQTNIKERRRFRRLIPSEKIARLAEMLNKIS